MLDGIAQTNQRMVLPKDVLAGAAGGKIGGVEPDHFYIVAGFACRSNVSGLAVALKHLSQAWYVVAVKID